MLFIYFLQWFNHSFEFGLSCLYLFKTCMLYKYVNKCKYVSGWSYFNLLAYIPLDCAYLVFCMCLCVCVLVSCSHVISYFWWPHRRRRRRPGLGGTLPSPPPKKKKKKKKIKHYQCKNAGKNGRKRSKFGQFSFLILSSFFFFFSGITCKILV